MRKKTSWIRNEGGNSDKVKVSPRLGKVVVYKDRLRQGHGNDRERSRLTKPFLKMRIHVKEPFDKIFVVGRKEQFKT